MSCEVSAVPSPRRAEQAVQLTVHRSLCVVACRRAGRGHRFLAQILIDHALDGGDVDARPIVRHRIASVR